MKIGIIGQGYVGSAVKILFQKYYDVFTYDINPDISNCKTINELVNQSNIIFVCVPTPMNKDGSCNINTVREVIETINKISNLEENKIVAIKSTIIPGSTDDLISKNKNISILFNPEFLTEANYIEDFKNQDRIIIGGDNKVAEILKDIYACFFRIFPF